MDTDKLTKLFREKLNRIRRELWYGEFEKVKCEPEYHHDIAVEKVWSEYLSSIGCKSFGAHELQRDFTKVFNENPETVCVSVDAYEKFVLVPRELAFRMLVLGGMP